MSMKFRNGLSNIVQGYKRYVTFEEKAALSGLKS